jgi:hypothetical protein
MPLIIRDKSYPLPKENGSLSPTGREIIEIENHFGLDGLTLLQALSTEEGKERPGYSKVKALYALAWICMVRAGEVVSISDILDEYGIDEIKPEDSDSKNLAAVSGAALTEKSENI